MKVAPIGAAMCMLFCSCAVDGQSGSAQVTPLVVLIQEAEAGNPQISSAGHSYEAARYRVKQATTLPDPQVTVQQLSVGSPRPLAGYTNSEFAYIGIGVSQEFPYPGKLRLRGQAAATEVEVQQAQADALRQSIAEQVREMYLHLSYVQSALMLVESNIDVLQHLADTELSRYKTGQGTQSSVLNAQLERTKMVRERTMRRGEAQLLQAELKLLVHRPQQSEDITAEALVLTSLPYDAASLLGLSTKNSPDVRVQKSKVREETAALRATALDKKPDIGVGYMYQKTGPTYRDYYMLTVDLHLHRRRRVQALSEEAAEMVRAAQDTQEAVVQQQLSEVQKQYVACREASDLLTEYREGLVPQAEAVFRSELTEYQSNKSSLAPALSALSTLLAVQRESSQALLDHEIAIGKLQQLTGETWR